MAQYKLLSATALYMSFLLIGHHGPLEQRAHAQPASPIISTEEILNDGTFALGTDEDDQPAVLGASTDPVVVVRDPETNAYLAEVRGMNEYHSKKIRSCLTKQTSVDQAVIEKCYFDTYPKPISQDHGHTHKKHSIKAIKNEDELQPYLSKSRKSQPLSN
jgi:hypothetical protein